MLITLGIDDRGFVALIGSEQINIRSATKWYEFLNEFQDETFIFSPSLDTNFHSKIWVMQALGELNVLSVNLMTRTL